MLLEATLNTEGNGWRLKKRGLKGLMDRRGNPYDKAKAGFMKTRKIEEIYLMAHETCRRAAWTLLTTTRLLGLHLCPRLNPRKIVRGKARADLYLRWREVASCDSST